MDPRRHFGASAIVAKAKIFRVETGWSQGEKLDSSGGNDRDTVPIGVVSA